jgi:hypothetical protein
MRNVMRRWHDAGRRQNFRGHCLWRMQRDSPRNPCSVQLHTRN